jgi:hypothetical protein
VKGGVFERAWKVLLEYYDQAVGIDWKWQALDGVITKAPLGGEATGPSPVDRAVNTLPLPVLPTPARAGMRASLPFFCPTDHRCVFPLVHEG